MSSSQLTDAFINEPVLFDYLVDGMLRRLKNPKYMFIFVYCFIEGQQQNKAAEILGVHETQIVHDIKKIREALKPYRTIN